MKDCVFVRTFNDPLSDSVNNVCATRSPCNNGDCVPIIPQGSNHQTGDTEYACSCGKEFVGETCNGMWTLVPCRLSCFEIDVNVL